MKNKILILPLVLVEVYLISTLALVEWGPIAWRLHNVQLFWTLMALYHLFFIFGYMFCLKRWRGDAGTELRRRVVEDAVLKYFWLVLFVAFVGGLIGYRNLVHSDSYIPFNMLQDFYDGLINPGARYYYKLGDQAAENFAGNSAVTAFYAAISFVRYSLIPMLVFMWLRLTWFRRFAGLLVAFIPFVAGVSVGTNKPIFDTLFMFAGALFIEFFVSYRRDGMTVLTRRGGILLIIGFLTVFSPLYFKHALGQRVASVSYIEKSAINNDVYVKCPSQVWVGERCEMGRLKEISVGLTGYVVQGYYGLSLALNQEFDSTFGIGNSMFLINSFKKFFDIDVASRTFQHKINNAWSELGQWHSFYSQVANDVGFWGVIVIMFGLGVLLCRVWISALEEEDIFAKLLLIILMIMFIYMPANNQVFNIMESLFSFWALLFLWAGRRLLSGRLGGVDPGR